MDLKLFGLDESEALNGISIHELLLDYNNANSVHKYLYGNLLKKNRFIETDVDPEAAAIQAFMDGEKRCALYNVNFDKLLAHPGIGPIMGRWRREVRRIMGKPTIYRTKITSGATTTAPSGNFPLERFLDPQCTPTCDAFMRANGNFGLAVPWDKYSTCVGSKTVVVSKTARIGRLVSPEPAINAFWQSAWGITLAQRLLATGINLSQAAEKHKRIARIGSITGRICTQDQSNASGLIYTELVRFLLSAEWFYVLNACRSHVTLLDGKEHQLQCFTTMGNGFCFELETIIFLGMLRALIPGHHDIHVFGDDMIYPAEHADLVIRFSDNIGFRCNHDKTFHSGPFRESCGGDFIDGVDVRPVYLKQDTTPYGLTVMANQLRGLIHKHTFDRNLYKLWLRLWFRIPPKQRLWGPSHLQCLHGSPRRWRILTSKRGKEMIRTWSMVPERETSVHLSAKTDPELTFQHAIGGLLKGKGLAHFESVDPLSGKRQWKCKYSSFPASGTKYVARIETKMLFLSPSLCDHRDPLSVFDILADTNCPRRLYTRAGYFLTLEREKSSLQKELLAQFRVLLARRQQEVDTLISDQVFTINF